MPTDFYTVVFPDGTQPPEGLQSFPISPFPGTLFTTLSRYLFHQRWIWNASYLFNNKSNNNALSRILSTITRYINRREKYQELFEKIILECD